MESEKLFETDHWNVILINEQSYLGRIIVDLKRKTDALSNLTNEEMIDFLEVVKKFEAVLKKTFNATMFNWTCLMNDAYKDESPKPQVHWHCRPRYNHAVEFNGKTFEDPDFGSHYNRDRKDFISKELLEKIAEEIKKNL
jgi:diadenosine tetraphosphate (Ap4A) HIT family hydrolase